MRAKTQGDTSRAASSAPSTAPSTALVSDSLGAPTLVWLLPWALLTVGGLGVLAATYFVDLPVLVERISAAVVATMVAAALAWRTGGRVLATSVVVGILMAGVVVIGSPIAYAGATVFTAVAVAVLALMATQPAATFLLTSLQVVFAVGVATVGGLAVTGWRAELNHDRYDYVVLAGAIVGAAILVYRLGAGLHGLGRRGYLVAAAALAIIAIALAYTEAMSRWGPEGFLEQIQAVRSWVVDTFGAVPHPIETLLGIPAIAWGVFMRARRRQGWWVCAFGAAATAPTTERFMEHGLAPQGVILGAVYTLVLGLVLGYLVIRIEQAFTGSKGARARRAEEAGAIRPEPSMLHPLS